MRKYNLPSLLLIAFTFIIINCTKEGPEGPAGAQGSQGNPGLQGATGPAGPAGTPGATGPAGPAGATGPAGPAGTNGAPANVIYSAWHVPTNWRDTILNTENYRISDVTATSITASIINQGVILAYIRNTYNTDGPFLLPLAQVGYVISFLPAVGKMFYTSLSFNQSVWITPLNREYRWVLIPGLVAGGRMASGPAKGYSVAQLSAMSYQQIASLFRIPANGTNIR